MQVLILMKNQVAISSDPDAKSCTSSGDFDEELGRISDTEFGDAGAIGTVIRTKVYHSRVSRMAEKVGELTT